MSTGRVAIIAQAGTGLAMLLFIGGDKIDDKIKNAMCTVFGLAVMLECMTAVSGIYHALEQFIGGK